MADLLHISRQPRVTIEKSATALDAARRMVENRVGAVSVLGEEGRLAGIFTERDLMKKVVAAGRDPATTPLAEVMTFDVKTLSPDAEAIEALRLMLEHQFRHAPVVDASGRVVGMLSLRDLLRHQVEELDRELDSVIERFTNDAPGG